MNIQQFQYILAVAEYRHFETAAEMCFVTQSTLSTMISRFEDEINIKIFDRKKKPVQITQEGKRIIEQLKIINQNVEQLKELSKEIKGDLSGKVSIAVIPTIAPFLLPLFLQNFALRLPDLEIQVKEQTTEEIVRKLKSRELDIGILSTPVEDPDLVERHLYDESFLYFDIGRDEKGALISPDDLVLNNLCLLEEGHCMRTQILRLCDLHKADLHNTLNFDYKAGSIDSLLRFVKANSASTLLPYLATLDLSHEDRKHLSDFIEPVPYRSIGLIVHRHFVKNRILEELNKEILSSLEDILPQTSLKGEKLMPV